MPATSFLEYAHSLRDALDSMVDAGDAVLTSFQIDARSSVQGLIEGSLVFYDGSELFLREFLDMRRPEPRLMYAYHYQDASGALIFRYDNAAHRPALPRPEHKHTGEGVNPSDAPSLADVLDQIFVHLG